jgi:hypothetical protein
MYSHILVIKLMAIGLVGLLMVSVSVLSARLYYCYKNMFFLVNGNWADWTKDGVCECKSGKTGEQKYNRTCTNPAPKHTGNDCDTSFQGSTRTESCDCLTGIAFNN